MAPLLLGFILGGMLEDNLRRAFILSGGEFAFLWERPMTLALVILTTFTLFVPLLRSIIERIRTRSAVRGL